MIGTEKTCSTCKKWEQVQKIYMKGQYREVGRCPEWKIHYVAEMSCARWEGKEG